MKEWDKYWSEKKTISGVLFDKVAVFYRSYIIPGILNFFLNKNYKPGSVLLHAGCGSGKVDEKVTGRFKLLSMDISMQALRMNNSQRALLQGDIFRLPVKESSVDGVYNLGVMEHFNENEITIILAEFKRVLKPGGKITLFWPPEFGSSEIFLKMAHFIANNILKKNMKLSPDEITLVRSYAHVEAICERTGLRIADYYFGPRDLFTYTVLTLKE